MLGKLDAPEVTAFLAAVRGAKALVFATPVYKAVYSGGLKTIIDLIAPATLFLLDSQLKVEGSSLTLDEAAQKAVDAAHRALTSAVRG